MFNQGSLIEIISLPFITQKDEDKKNKDDEIR